MLIRFGVYRIHPGSMEILLKILKDLNVSYSWTSHSGNVKDRRVQFVSNWPFYNGEKLDVPTVHLAQRLLMTEGVL